MNMCRFNGKSDDGYEKLHGILAKYIGQIKTQLDESDIARRDGQSSSDLWFDFPDIDDSHHTNALLFQTP